MLSTSIENSGETDFNLQDSFQKKLVKHHSKRSNSAEMLAQRHTGLLGLKAFIEAFPYDVPPMVPDVLTLLAQHINEPPMLSVSSSVLIRKLAHNLL